MSQLLAVVFALLAAPCVAVGMVVRQRAVQDQSRRESSDDAVATSWVSQPPWWAGTVASLLFVLPLGARFSRQHIRRADWWWSVLLTASLTVFVLVGRPSDGEYRPSVAAWTIALTGAALLVVACTAGATRVTGRMRALLLAVAVPALGMTG